MIRSESMSLYQLLIPRESSYDVMSELGQLDSVMIIDHQQHILSKPFINQVQRCDEILYKVEYLIQQFQQIGECVEKVYDFKLMLQEFDRVLSTKHIQKHTFVNQIEEYITQKYGQVQQQIDTLARLKSKLQMTKEAKQAMIFARNWLGLTYFQSKSSTALDFDEQMIKSHHQHGGMMPTQKFTHFCGVMDAKDYPIFQRTIFRVTKGNFMEQQELLSITRCCFLLIFPCFSLQSETWRKIKKLQEVLKVDHVSLPVTEDLWDQKYCEFDKEINEIEHTEKLTQQLLHSILKPLLEEESYQPSLLFIRFYLVRERTLYENLNKVKMQQSIFLANMWVRQSEIGILEQVLQTIKLKNPHLPAPQIKKNIINKKPPTYFHTNQFNKIFQLITETYGIPNYKEINPSIFSIITFPFLFGVMFGDIAHGAALISFGILLSLNKIFSPRSEQKRLRQQRILMGIQVDKKINSQDTNDEDLNDMNFTQMIFDFRYMFLLCGIFALYCGFIYNEYFGFQLNIFGSCKNQADCTYPFGMDPLYAEDLNYSNSYKMKLAIIIGFFQMLLGIICMGFNSHYFKQWTQLLIIFPCKLLFFLLFVGYMVLLIIVKWSTYYQDTSQAPSIITTLVDMWMHNGSVTLPIFDSSEGQVALQQFIVIVCIICLPTLLIVPIIRDVCNMLKTKKRDPSNQQEFEMVPLQNMSDSSNEDLQIEENHPTSLLDIIVEHLIETLEFALGCISNTASYLRLWALSLAHSELSQVLYQLTLGDPIGDGDIVTSLLGMPAFLLATFGILLCMDSMECFLHALRLHWVEFQSKFFKGDGYSFQVFSYRQEMQKYQDKMK